MTSFARTRKGPLGVITSILLLCMATTALSSCASMTYPLPKCDGYSRRPLNRSMWQWENDSNHKPKYSDERPATSSRVTTAYAEEGRKPLAFAHPAIDASYHSCGGVARW
ncbi:hypothetical protein [Ensifer sp. MJa1]|uniref:hypothetical protein n=1 Tax=Ensifer sp. MJa1 TaxID=2919888 RepID=UPI00300B38F3